MILAKVIAQLDEFSLTIENFGIRKGQFEAIERLFGVSINQEEFWESVELAKVQKMRKTQFVLSHRASERSLVYTVEL